MIYKFSATAVPVKPDTITTALLEKAMKTKQLTRTEKNKIAETLYNSLYNSTFSDHIAIYKISGWAWNMKRYLKRVLVSYTYDPNTYHTYYAPDKTSLRKVLNSVYEMIEA